MRVAILTAAQSSRAAGGNLALQPKCNQIKEKAPGARPFVTPAVVDHGERLREARGAGARTMLTAGAKRMCQMLLAGSVASKGSS
jgi:hypothetical protein